MRLIVINSIEPLSISYLNMNRRNLLLIITRTTFVVALLMLSSGCKTVKYLQQQNSSLLKQNERLHLENTNLLTKITGIQEELNMLQHKNPSVERRPDPKNPVRPPVKLYGRYKSLENFSEKVTAIECDLKTLKSNFPNGCFIRVATVRRLNYVEVSRLLEDYGHTIFFIEDNGKVRIYIGPSDSQTLLSQIRANAFPDALIDCNLKFDVNTQKTTPVPWVKRSTKADEVRKSTDPSPLYIYEPRFTEYLLDGATLEVEGEISKSKREKTFCRQGSLTFEFKKDVPPGMYIQLAAVKNFDCANFSHCQYLDHLIVLTVYDNPDCNYRVLSEELDKFDSIKTCKGFDKIERRRL